MTRIIGESLSGKTKALLEQCAAVEGLLVCANPRAMHEKAKAYGLPTLSYMSYEEYERNRLNGSIQVPVFIDEFESFLKELDSHFSGYSMTLGE